MGASLRACYETLLVEYEVEPDKLEADLVELVNDLVKNGLVEIATA